MHTSTRAHRHIYKKILSNTQLHCEMLNLSTIQGIRREGENIPNMPCDAMPSSHAKQPQPPFLRYLSLSRSGFLVHTRVISFYLYIDRQPLVHFSLLSLFITSGLHRYHKSGGLTEWLVCWAQAVSNSIKQEDRSRSMMQTIITLHGIYSYTYTPFLKGYYQLFAFSRQVVLRLWSG